MALRRSTNTLPIFGAPHFRGGGAFLGDAMDRAYDPTTPAYLAWQADVKRRGGVVTVMPAAPGSPPNTQTPPAARFPKAGGGWTYELAPLEIVSADVWQRYKNSVTIALGKGAAVGEDVLKAIAQAPKKAFELATGIPGWLLPVVLLVGGAAFAMHKLGVDFRKPGQIQGWLRGQKSNPQGRRRRRRHASHARRRRRG